jgi:S-DNA-T family DNA segregation ATPase FtsK/SpoIIIE
MTYSLNTLNNPQGEAGASRAGLSRFGHEIVLVLGLLALVLWFLSLASYSALDGAWSTTGAGGPVRNWGGRLGAWLADGSYFFLGLSVWWCFAAGLRAWLSALARWMRGNVEHAVELTGFSRSRTAFWVGMALLLVASSGLEWSRLYRLESHLPGHAGGVLGFLTGPTAVPTRWK